MLSIPESCFTGSPLASTVCGAGGPARFY